MIVPRLSFFIEDFVVCSNDITDLGRAVYVTL